MPTCKVPEGSEMCGGDSERMTGCSDGHRDKTTPPGETSWRFRRILLGKHTWTQSISFLHGFIDCSGEMTQGSKGIRGFLEG